MQQNNLKIKFSKCKVAQERIEYLSHVISHGKIQPSPEKVKDLFKYEAPLSSRQIYSFIGLASYYRKFIKGFASIMSPLLRAAQERKINWTNECQQAFTTIRDLLTQEPILDSYQNTDACNYGVGAVLTQE